MRERKGRSDCWRTLRYIQTGIPLPKYWNNYHLTRVQLADELWPDADRAESNNLEDEDDDEDIEKQIAKEVKALTKKPTNEQRIGLSLSCSLRTSDTD
jgi:hypothetical protein